VRLTDLPVGARAEIVRVSDQSADRLRYLSLLGLIPGAHVQVLAIEPFDGPISVRIGEEASTPQPVDQRLAQTILVHHQG
jgi:Fe2+ transport system protein FeoA